MNPYGFSQSGFGICQFARHQSIDCLSQPSQSLKRSIIVSLCLWFLQTTLIQNQRSITWLIIVLASGIIALLIACILWLKPKTLSKQPILCRRMPLYQSIWWIAVPSNRNQPHHPSPRTLPLPTSLPKSLQGTQVDGEIIIDENKQLVVTAGLRRLFDYFCQHKGRAVKPD